jgi:hypothetical protein
MGSQFLYPRLPHLSLFPIDFSTSGDKILVPGVASYRILIHRIWFVVGGATNVIFKDGSTAISGTVPLSANGGLTFDATGEPWFSTSLGKDFVINSSLAVQVGGIVHYTLGQ